MVGLGIELRQDQWDKISDESLTFILSESDKIKLFYNHVFFVKISTIKVKN